MAGLESTINIRNSEYRPCIILGKKALFHRWTEKKNIVLECNPECFRRAMTEDQR